jgi:two-component system cell cycle sensor histidine kinase/response regulator CckA
VDLVLALDPNPGKVRADPVQMEQVIINLAVNAADAMPDGGILKIATAHGFRVEGGSAGPSGMAPGRYVLLSVSDSGIGMADEVKAHLFEPFFTTKPEGKGTGLGLANVYGIVSQSGGYIQVESQQDRGTIFRVFLPEANIS